MKFSFLPKTRLGKGSVIMMILSWVCLSWVRASMEIRLFKF